MVSAPEDSTRRSRALWLLLWPLLATCSDHEVGVNITAAGVAFLETACHPACDRIESPDGSALASCSCVLPDVTARVLDGHPAEARIVLWTPHDGRIRDQGKCMSLLPCKKGNLARQAACLADSLNQQLDGAIPGGLGFHGLKHASDAELVIAFYSPSHGEENEAHCALPDLIACAGLSPPLSGGSYDIACASCAAGAKVAVGRDTGPCPRAAGDKNACFLQNCAAMLASESPAQ